MDPIEDGEGFTFGEHYQLALRSVLRWTNRRDQLTDAEIIRAIKKVTATALERRN